ncbi:hypothetical protein [Flavobacterium sp. HJJ]|uniref:hypothetical protein n=1 Tax=Flavobacterium sp. HJJ TaxID=2783792 RepID=UPI00188D1277|nr:hypothetical protein [Flavobacterium sp. HJJ]MBF4470706.1 hypothetical protein [Flavobacterium sp. HJJ]
MLILTLVSCTKQNPIEKTLIANSGEYWKYYTSTSDYTSYYQFKDDHLSYPCSKDEDYKFYEDATDGVMSEQHEKWSVTDDSIMTFRHFKYDVVSYNDKVVVLLALTENEPYTRYIFLIKENKNNPTVSGFYAKRKYNPEKYLLSK